MKSFNQKNIHCAKAYKRGPQKASRNFAFNAAAIAASICFAWQASFASDNVNDDSAKKTTIQDNLNYSISDHFSVVSGGNNSADDNYGLYIVNSTITFSTTPDQMNSGKMLMTAFNSKSGSFNEMKISNSTLTSNQPQNTNSIIVVFGTGQKFTSNKLWIDNNSSVSNVNEIYAVHGVTHAGAQINDNHIYIGSASDSQRTNLVRDTQIIGSWASIPYGEIKNNSVEIVNAQIGGDDETLITAAYAAETGINVDIQNNMVSVSNSDLRNDFIVAAYVSGSASANNNTVTIGTGVTTGTGILTLNALFGGFAPGSEYARFFSGNTGITLLRLDLKCQVQPRFFCPPENRAVDSSPKSQFGLEVAKKSGRHASVTTLIDPTDFQLCAITVKTHVGLDSRSGASASSPYFA